MKRSSQDQQEPVDKPGRTVRGALSRFRASYADASATVHTTEPSTSHISSDFVITGNISCKGQAQFDGEVHGNIECSRLVVGKNGRIFGDITAEHVVIFGTVEGAIQCHHVALKSGAVVKGDVYHQGIAIEMGASFMGRSGTLPSKADDGAVSVTQLSIANSEASSDHIVPKITNSRTAAPPAPEPISTLRQRTSSAD